MVGIELVFLIMDDISRCVLGVWGVWQCWRDVWREREMTMTVVPRVGFACWGVLNLSSGGVLFVVLGTVKCGGCSA